MTNTTAAQNLLTILRAETTDAHRILNSPPITYDGDTTTQQVRDAAVKHHTLGGRLYELQRFAALADDLGDITTDATDDDADSIITTTLDHLQRAASFASYGAGTVHPADLTDPVAVSRYATALLERAAAQRFVNYLTDQLGDLAPEYGAQIQILAALEETRRATSTLDSRRDDLVRQGMAMQPPISRSKLAGAAGVSEPRLYQIRDGR